MKKNKPKTNYFSGIIGLEPLKKHLNFLIDAYNESEFLNNILFSARFGSGKTTICQLIGKALIDPDTGKQKKFIRIDCSTLRSVKSFMDQVIFPYCLNNKCTLFFNEIHLTSKEVLDFLLTMLEYDAHTKSSTFSYDGNTYTIHFKGGLVEYFGRINEC
jgi:Holliday junction resolvasome RuvABC ATP-dependent DNA helicase subunit